jgi:hypothetical protein
VVKSESGKTRIVHVPVGDSGAMDAHKEKTALEKKAE